LLSVAVPPAGPVPPEIHTPQAALLYVRVLGPEGMRTTYFPGTPAARTFAGPEEVGLRPGYIYRLELSNLNVPGGKLYPSLEVRGMLNMPLAQAARHPVPLVFTAEELRRVTLAGSMITKVFFLEDPSLAPPIQTDPNDPLVFEVPSDTEAIHEARNRGRPMVIVRLGENQPSPDELARVAVPNTILFPGDARLTIPPVPPYIPWMNWPVFDPVLGAERTAEECLPDGGDVGPRVGIGPDGRLGGLNASDTAMEFTTESGKRKTVVSNRICVLVPRFAIARQEIAPAGLGVAVGLNGAKGIKGFSEASSRVPTNSAEKIVMVASTTGRKLPSQIQGRVLLHGFDNIKGVKITAQVNGTRVVGQVKEPEEISAPLCISLYKWADPKEAQIGDIVTFYLRYHNNTKQAVDNISVSDSLTARLEYVSGSAKSDREAVLTIQPNEVGSVVLRWDVAGKLPPGQSGVLAFQARVR
jgi:uncharacterized repeat protein (TIGR01451 family)